MPEIPLFVNENRLGQLPGPVLDREARPRVNAGSLIAGVGRVAEAAQGSDISQFLGPLSPEHFGASSAKALGSLGEGIKQAGGVLGEIAQRKQKAVNDRHQVEARNLMDGTSARFAEWKMKNPNPDGWAKKWGEMSAETLAAIEKGGYSQAVKDRMMPDGLHWQNQGLIEAETSAAKETFNHTAQVYESRIASLMDQGKYGEAKVTVQQGSDGGYFSPRQADAISQQLDHQEKSSLRADDTTFRPNEVIRWMENPEATDTPEHFKNLNDRQRFELLSSAKLTRAQRQTELLQRFKQMADDGELQNDHDLLRFIEATSDDPVTNTKGYMEPRLMPVIRSIMKGGGFDLHAFNEVQRKTYAFDPKDPEAALKETQLRQEMVQFPEDYQQVLESDLEQAKAGKTSAQAFQYGLNEIALLHKEQRLTRDDGTPLEYKADAFMMDAVVDAEKIKVFGLTQRDAKKLSERQGQARLLLFDDLLKARQAGTSRVRVIPTITDMEAFNKLTDFTKNLFTSYVRHGEFVDTAVRSESARRQAQLSEDYIQWYRSKPTAPMTSEVDGWLTMNTGRERQAKAIRILTPTASPLAVPPTGMVQPHMPGEQPRR